MKRNPTEIEKELQQIIMATEKLDFPWMSTFTSRQTILQEEKNKIDAQIEKLVVAYGFDDVLSNINCADLWKQADVTARKKFGNIAEKQMLNGFYLQEIMHQYAEIISKAIISKID